MHLSTTGDGDAAMSACPWCRSDEQLTHGD
jgi:hypothetical protein